MAQLASARPAQASYEQPSPENIFRVGLGFWGSKALLSAVEPGVFTTLAQGPLEGEALREKLGIHPRGARDFFDALVSLGFLERNGTVYNNTAETDLFLDREKPSYIGGLFDMCNARSKRCKPGSCRTKARPAEISSRPSTRNQHAYVGSRQL